MQLPLISDYLSWNACAMASKSYMVGRMAKRANLAILLGGFEEATLYKRGEQEVERGRKKFSHYGREVCMEDFL